MEDCTEALDNNLQVDNMYLDFKKASDCVSHKCLFLELFCNFQKLRKVQNKWKLVEQRVIFNGKFSKWNYVLSGIPQPSILGPILFKIYIKNLPGVVGSVCQLLWMTVNYILTLGLKQTWRNCKKALKDCVNGLEIGYKN